MEATEAGQALHIPLDLTALGADFLSQQEALTLANPAVLPAASTSIGVKGPAYIWMLANLALAHTQQWKGPPAFSDMPVTAVWIGPTTGSQMGTANTFLPQAGVAGFSLGTNQDPNQIKVSLAASPVLPRDLGAGTFAYLCQAKSEQPTDAGYLTGWLGFLTTAILMLAGLISVVIALTAEA